MKSLDTNILFYAMKEDGPEYEICSRFVAEALRQPHEWMVADQTWFELYRLLRNGRLLEFPLSAAEADDKVDYYRNRSGWSRCAWEPATMEKLRTYWQAEEFPARQTFDLVLALTLKANGVTELFTRNTKDFESYGFFQVTDPLA